MPYVSFVNNGGRTGNNIFQYLAAKLIQIKYGHTYVPFGDLTDGTAVTESDYDTDLTTYNNIICKGYFQKSEFFVPYREHLITAIKDCDDYWFDDYGNKIMIRDFFHHPSSENLSENDVVSLSYERHPSPPTLFGHSGRRDAHGRKTCDCFG